MRRSGFATLCLLLICRVALGKSPLESRIDAYVLPFVQLRTFSGAILVAKGDRVLARKAYGLANEELRVANTPSMKFQLASVSKMFTAAAVLILQQRGLLRVSVSISKYVPAFPNGDRITIHHLLTDTSGIPNINSMPEYEREVKLPHSLPEIIALFREKPLQFETGKHDWSESSANWVLLAYVIERVSGETYGDFLRRNVFEPCGMANTGHRGDQTAVLRNRASGYMPVGRLGLANATYIDWSFKTGNGSVYSTVGDLFRWSRALAKQRILKRDSIDVMFRQKYGWFTGERAGHAVVRYSGRAPGFGAEVQYFPVESVFIAVLSNNYATTASLIGDGLAAMVFGQPYEQWHVRTDVRPDPRILSRYVGLYVFGPDFLVPNASKAVEMRGDELVSRSGGVETALISQSDREFVDRGFSAWITFEPDGASLLFRYGDRSFRAVRRSAETPAN